MYFVIRWKEIVIEGESIFDKPVKVWSLAVTIFEKGSNHSTTTTLPYNLLYVLQASTRQILQITYVMRTARVENEKSHTRQPNKEYKDRSTLEKLGRRS